jgi:acyl-CoA thioesterase I
MRMAGSLKEVLDQLKKGEQVVVAGLGDSRTQGWMVDRGFFERFCDALEEAFPEARLRRINDGIPGSTAPEGLRRLPALLARQPDLVIVQFGLNDCFSGISLETFLDAYDGMAKAILAANVLPVLVTSCPVQDPSFDDEVSRFYAGIAEVGERNNVPVADLDDAWRHDTSRRPTDLYQWDGVHPTDQGHKVMAEGLLASFTREIHA